MKVSQDASEGSGILEGRERPVTGRFIALLTLAQVGAFLSFMPLLTILTPLKAQLIDPTNKTSIMAQVSLLAAIMAGAANLLAGAISDRTVSRFGRRKPWILFGLVGSIGSYYLIEAAHNFLGLLLGLLAFQFFFNFLFGPLAAVLPDQVPDSQKGRVSGFTGLAQPVGSLSGILLAGLMVAGDEVRYGAIAVILTVAVAPFLVLAKDPPTHETEWLAFARVRRPSYAFNPLRYPDFAVAWVSRLLIQFAMGVISIFALFYVQDKVSGLPAGTAQSHLAQLILVSTCVHMMVSLLGGPLSDRIGRRKPFVMASGLLLAVCMLSLSLAPFWTVTLIAYGFLGAGFGLYAMADAALVAQVLPSLEDAGAGLGVLNLANTLPQVLAPLLGLWLLGAHQAYSALFALAGLSALAGGFAVNLIRSIR